MLKNGHRKWPRVRIGKAVIDGISLPLLMRRLDEMVDSGRRHYVCFCEAHLCVRAMQEPDIRAILDGASLVLPDGVSMTAGARILGKKLPERLPGPIVMLKYCSYGTAKKRRHFFYGGADDVAECLAEQLRQKIPGLQVAGSYSPPFRPLTPDEEIDVKKRIEESGADVLWVGLGAPKQERWIAKYIKNINVPLMLGVGAAFDFHSGDRKWAPVWIRKLGLEWIYRMFTGGKRVFIRNAKFESTFIWLIMRQAIAEGLGFWK